MDSVAYSSGSLGYSLVNGYKNQLQSAAPLSDWHRILWPSSTTISICLHTLRHWGLQEAHCSPVGETQAGPGCVCHPGHVLGLTALVTVVRQAEPLVTGHCDGGSCLTLSSQRSALGSSQTPAAVLLHGWNTCCPLIISALLLAFFFLLSKCSLFSFSFFLSEDFTPVKYKAPAAPKPSKPVPPYNGFGSEEDSLSSCQGLLPKPPQKDFHKFMEKDRLDEMWSQSYYTEMVVL